MEGAKIKKNEDIYVSFINDYKINSYFSKGLYSNWFGHYMFQNSVTKCISIQSDMWDNIKTIDLYFVSKWESREDESSYTLFMVMKEQISKGGSYKEVYSSFKKSITKTLGSAPIDKAVQYQNSSMEMDGTYEPALVGIWSLQTRKIFLLVRNIFFLQATQ